MSRLSAILLLATLTACILRHPSPEITGNSRLAEMVRIDQQNRMEDTSNLEEKDKLHRAEVLRMKQGCLHRIDLAKPHALNF